MAAATLVSTLVATSLAIWLVWLHPVPHPPAAPHGTPPQATAPLAAAPQRTEPQRTEPLAVAPAPALPAAPPYNPGTAAFALQTANEAEIRAHVADALTVFRFAANPDIIVLDFPTLLQQGLMLDRVAALVEKAGLPRDRVLTDSELDAAIRARGDTIATFYYGHDYPAAALARFFTLANRDHVVLNGQEQKLRALLRQLGWLGPEARGALISIPRVGADPNVTMPVRAAILRHELSHGQFFSDPDYTDYTRRFWRTALTEPERAGVRRFLGSQDYDTADEELMLNEMQAYLMFTLDPHFFSAADIGMTRQRREQLQAAFLRGLNVGWLRDDMEHPLTAAEMSDAGFRVPSAACPPASPCR